MQGERLAHMASLTLYSQRRNECLLASLCSVLGRDYREASADFERQHGATWGHVIGKVEAWTRFAREYLGVQLPAKVCFDLPGHDIDTLSTGGVLVWLHDSGGMHATAYAQGIVYDACLPAPMPLVDYQKGRQLAGSFDPRRFKPNDGSDIFAPVEHYRPEEMPCV